MTTPRMPVVFSAHGNPMNAIRDNAFTRFLGTWAGNLPEPRAILAVSAHWVRNTLAVTRADLPETIHDFYGFPDELYALRYPAPGSPSLAARVAGLLGEGGGRITLDVERGLDHGAWSPLLRLYPGAGIPVVQLSLLVGTTMERHLEIGRRLAPLRDEGVLLFGSGNLVHDLRTADLGSEQAKVEPWAREFDAWVASRLDAWDLFSLASFREMAPHGKRAHPTPEHFLPLLVAAGAAEGAGAKGPRPRVTYPYRGFEHGTIGMRCVTFE